MGTSMSGQTGGQGGQSSSTGARDVEYNLISIAYHSLQGADTLDAYIQDAQQSGDQDLAQFFRDVQQQNRQISERARQLLRRQAGGGK